MRRRKREERVESTVVGPVLPGLIFLAAVSTLAYIGIWFLSWRFEFDVPVRSRPILSVLILFGVVFACYLYAVSLARRAHPSQRLVQTIWWGAVIFRLLMVSSLPIQEIDIYRYLWDGAVGRAGISPFVYSPRSVIDAHANNENLPIDLRRLASIRDASPELATVLHRIHFPHLTTIYPPTSQLVFAAVSWVTPRSASVTVRIIVMKACFVVFDLLTLHIVFALLRLVGWPVGLAIVYGWCPLLMKEYAGSGHHDAIAVCLSMVSIYFAASLWIVDGTESGQSKALDRKTRFSTVAAVVALSAAIGAKIFPIVLVPIILFAVVRRTSWLGTLGAGGFLTFATGLILWPMLTATPYSPERGSAAAAASAQIPALPDAEEDSVETTGAGLQTFFRQWEMNDFIFLLIFENLKPTADLSPGQIAWFSIVPESFRHQWIAVGGNWWGVNAEQMAFYVTRAITSTLFITLVGYFLYSVARDDDRIVWLRAAFLTLAWFWLLCPTQNPWYWTWSVPLLAFARSRVWLWMSGLVLLYYLRFWLDYHWPVDTVLGTVYAGAPFFDFCVTWVEFGPWLICLALLRKSLIRRDAAGIGAK